MLVSVLDQDLSSLHSNHLVSFTTDHSCSVPGWGEADHGNKERDSCDVPEEGAWGSGPLPRESSSLTVIPCFCVFSLFLLSRFRSLPSSVITHQDSLRCGRKVLKISVMLL